MLNKIKNLSIIYISLMAIFLVSMILTYTIPNSKIDNHVKESAEQLMVEGVYPRVFLQSESTQLDNFTDSWMLNIAISGNTKTPLKSALSNTYREVAAAENKVDNLDKVIKGEDSTTGSYSRYWHGYLVFLRPLLTMFNYLEIRYINMFGLFGVFLSAVLLIRKKLGIKHVVGFFATMMMMMFIIVPMSLQYSSVFYIVLISIIIILMKHKKLKEKDLALYLFFIIGAVTSFLDLLTAPLLTLGIPLIIYLLAIEKESDLASNFIETIKNSVVWAVGYGTTWASKWIIASIVLKDNVVKNALKQLLVRSSSTTGEVIVTKKQVILQNTELIFNSFTMKFLIMGLVVALIIYLFNMKPIKETIKMLPLLLIGLFPFIWYVILANHSYIHYCFTYRSLGITILAVISFIVHGIKTRRIKDGIQ